MPAKPSVEVQKSLSCQITDTGVQIVATTRQYGWAVITDNEADQKNHLTTLTNLARQLIRLESMR